MFCKNCGRELPEGALFCGGCGYSYNNEGVAESKSTPEPKKPKGKGGIVALIIVLVILAVSGTAWGLYESGVFDDSSEDEKVEERKDKKEDEQDKDIEEKEEEQEQEESQKESEPVNDKVVKTPKISECTAISTLESDGKNTYSPNNLIDDNPATAWVEGYDGDGVGDCVHVYLEERAEVTKISLLNGYCKDEERFFNNNRVKEMEIVFLKDNEEGSETVAKRTQIFQDSFNSWEDINLGLPVECDRINLFIRSVYPGEKYNDTCISEIKVQ